jgi:copper resistance protein B
MRCGCGAPRCDTASDRSPRAPTPRLIAQPRTELDFSAHDVREHEIGDGLSSFELELWLRYEIRRELAPYLGVSWQRKVGDPVRAPGGERASSRASCLG